MLPEFHVALLAFVRSECYDRKGCAPRIPDQKQIHDNALIEGNCHRVLGAKERKMRPEPEAGFTTNGREQGEGESTSTPSSCSVYHPRLTSYPLPAGLVLIFLRGATIATVTIRRIN